MLKLIPGEARWHRSELPLLIETVAKAVRSSPHETEPPQYVKSGIHEDTDECIETECAVRGWEAEPMHVGVRDVEQALAHSAPAVLLLPGHDFAGLLSVSRTKARLIGRDGRRCIVPLADLRDVLCAPAEARFKSDIDALLRWNDGSLGDPERVRTAMLRKRAGAETVLLGWQMRLPAGSGFFRQIVQTGVRRQVLAFCAACGTEYVLSLVAWWLLGAAALSGHFDFGWLLAWTLLIASGLVFRAWKASCNQLLAVGLGGLVKQRLIAGATRLHPDTVRHSGVGAMLARVMEAESLESLALGGALGVFVAPIELVLSGMLLCIGAGGVLHGMLLLGWITVVGGLVWRNHRLRGGRTAKRLAMTNDLVDRMTGHRTRVAQESPERWHTGEDELLSAYVERSAEVDRSAAILATLAPRFWLLLGLAALVPAFLRSAPTAAMAVSVAAVMLAMRSLRTLATGLIDISGAVLAWRHIGPLFRAAADVDEPGASSVPGARNTHTLVEARDLSFRYPERAEPVLRGCDVAIRRGDRILLEGASGNGKSTLASLLAGLRKPGSGLLLAGGMDYRTLGEHRWRRRVAYAPQSHENHIFSGSLAFNLLMGRGRPPRGEDLRDAEAVCSELGLGDLLARMPARLNQIVGESGWQLSEGERGRVFLGRALLAGAELVVLDECFSALDPESLVHAYNAVCRRAPAAVVVAHP